MRRRRRQRGREEAEKWRQKKDTSSADIFTNAIVHQGFNVEAVAQEPEC